jgi:hypothetical protein
MQWPMTKSMELTIEKCVIMMCDPTNLYQEFVIRGSRE